MKTLLNWGVGCLMLTVSYVYASSANELFISEYVDGSGYNKAIELFNGNNQTLDLSEYELGFYLNGSNTISFTVPLSGVLTPYDTFVVANSLATSQILLVSDQTRNGIWFDGDDVVALIHNGEVIDSIGQVGVSTSSPWGRSSDGGHIGALRRLWQNNLRDVNLNDKVDFNQNWQRYHGNNFNGLGSYVIRISS